MYIIYLNEINGIETIADTIVLGDYLEGGTIVFMFTLLEWIKRRSSDKVSIVLL